MLAWWGAEPRFELGLAVQHVSALPSELGRLLIGLYPESLTTHLIAIFCAAVLGILNIYLITFLKTKNYQNPNKGPGFYVNSRDKHSLFAAKIVYEFYFFKHPIEI
jgi:hypothetical protein